MTSLTTRTAGSPGPEENRGASERPRGLRRRAGVVVLWAAALAAMLLLVAPVFVLLTRAPWATVPEVLSDPDVRAAFLLSLTTATVSAVLCVLLGTPLAWLMSRARHKGRVRFVRALVILPLVLPPVVGGLALLLLLGRAGPVGGVLDMFGGVQIPFTAAAVVLAQTFVAMPFLVLSAEGAFRGVDERYEQAARTLGADSATVALRVTLPLAWPGIAAGAVLAWARALGEFGATVTLAGSFPGSTRTVPAAVYTALESNPEAAVAMAAVTVLLSLVVVMLLRDRWWRVLR